MLDAAVEVFSARGFHAASMDEIAERAGVSKPLLYLYLGSKEETFGACIAREAGRLIETVGDAVGGETATGEGAGADAAGRPGRPGQAGRLWRGLTAFFTFVATHRSSWIVLYQQARARGAAAGPLARARQEIIGMVPDLVLEAMTGPATTGRRDGSGALHRESAAVAHALVGAADAMADWALTVPGEPPEATARRLMDIVWVGLERRAAGDRFRPDGPGH
jgi:AcrR family transcriptional regulator